MGTLKSKSGLRKQPAIFFKKGIDRPRFMLYNGGTVEEAVGTVEAGHDREGGGFYIYKNITKNFFEKIAKRVLTNAEIGV